MFERRFDVLVGVVVRAVVVVKVLEVVVAQFCIRSQVGRALVRLLPILLLLTLGQCRVCLSEEVEAVGPLDFAEARPNQMLTGRLCVAFPRGPV